MSEWMSVQCVLHYNLSLIQLTVRMSCYMNEWMSEWMNEWMNECLFGVYYIIISD